MSSFGALVLLSSNCSYCVAPVSYPPPEEITVRVGDVCGPRSHFFSVAKCLQPVGAIIDSRLRLRTCGSRAATRLNTGVDSDEVHSLTVEYTARILVVRGGIPTRTAGQAVAARNSVGVHRFALRQHNIQRDDAAMTATTPMRAKNSGCPPSRTSFPHSQAIELAHQLQPRRVMKHQSSRGSTA